MFWNYQECGHPRFHSFLKEYRREPCSDFVDLFETRISEGKADLAISKPVRNKKGVLNSKRMVVINFVYSFLSMGCIIWVSKVQALLGTRGLFIRDLIKDFVMIFEFKDVVKELWQMSDEVVGNLESFTQSKTQCTLERKSTRRLREHEATICLEIENILNQKEILTLKQRNQNRIDALNIDDIRWCYDNETLKIIHLYSVKKYAIGNSLLGHDFQKLHIRLYKFLSSKFQ
ncbi:hypothetical protein CXB51_027384 [Gossypium anomalum]|uniref:Uncharacterized protein n=1 Tax=Gossypium anomalum TaxID=47600 RepID=A0A8J6CK81_9ROSI|nr:hypothetical protein CXB51_027384 [Gossypium anomalum]